MGDAKYPKPPIWLLIDGNNSIHVDAYGAGVERAASTFDRRLEEMIDHWQPAAVITAWDSGPSFRASIFPGYKAGRSKLPGIDGAIALARGNCLRRGVGVITAQGYEADDILATLAMEALAAGCRAVIYSQDKDLHQCIQDGEVLMLLKVKRVTKTQRTNHLEFTWRNAKDLRVQYGVSAQQWVDYRCMVGDPSDKIQGVAGVGHETAARLLQSCGTLDGFYAAPFKAALSDRQHAAMINAKPRIDTLRKLYTLCRDVPLPELWKEAI